MKAAASWIAALGGITLAASLLLRDALERKLGAGASAYLLTGGLILFLGGVLLRTFGPTLVDLRRTDRLRRRLGRAGKRLSTPILRIIEVGEAGSEIRVEITVRTVGDTEATFRTYVPRIDVPKQGDRITVLYDPDEPSVAVAY